MGLFLLQLRILQLFLGSLLHFEILNIYPERVIRKDGLLWQKIVRPSCLVLQRLWMTSLSIRLLRWLLRHQILWLESHVFMQWRVWFKITLWCGWYVFYHFPCAAQSCVIVRVWLCRRWLSKESLHLVLQIRLSLLILTISFVDFKAIRLLKVFSAGLLLHGALG